MKPFVRNLLVVVAVLALTMTTFKAAAGTESFKDIAENVFTSIQPVMMTPTTS